MNDACQRYAEDPEGNASHLRECAKCAAIYAGVQTKALNVDALVIMTNVPGLLENPEDQATIIRTVPADRLADYMEYARGRMRKKLLGAQEALQNGVPRVCIGHDSLVDVLNGAGTVIESVLMHAERNLT